MPTTSPSAEPLTAAKLQTLNAEVGKALAAYAEQPERDDLWRELLTMRRAVAAVIASLPSAQKTGLSVETAFALLHAFEESGVADQPAASEDLALAEQYRRNNWTGLVASMLLVPAWQSPSAPLLDNVQPWLWAEYTRWLFYTPKGFTAVGQASAYAAHYLKRLEELANWGTRNRGAAAVKAALQAYQNHANSSALHVASADLRQHMQMRARLLGALYGSGSRDDLLPTPCEGRLLRVGFIARDFGASPATYASLPLFEQLAPDRFQVILFTSEASESDVEDYCRTHSAEFHVLPKDTEAQLTLLRSGSLDVLVFCHDLTTRCDVLTELACHRVAPLQVATSASATTSGLPYCDLYLSGMLTAASHAQEQFTERLGLIPGSAHGFNHGVAPDEEDPAAFIRESLGLAEDVVLFVSVSSALRITPEVQKAWAQLLFSVPGSRLLLNPTSEECFSVQDVRRFCVQFDRVLKSHGVETDRLMVSDAPIRCRRELKDLIRAGDVYLDVFPCSQTESCATALELGVPVVTLEEVAVRSRSAAGFLRQIGLDSLVAKKTAAYCEAAASVASDRAARETLRERISTSLAQVPDFLDTLAISDAFGGLLLCALNEIATRGRSAFREDKQALACTMGDTEATLLVARNLLDAGLSTEAYEQVRHLLSVEPAVTPVRHLAGLAHAALGHWQRAAEYLVAAVQSGKASVVIWRDLAGVLKQAGDGKGAITALETAIRLDQSDPESWFALGEIAHEQGHQDLIRSVGEIVNALAPNDPRTLSYPPPIRITS